MLHVGREVYKAANQDAFTQYAILMRQPAIHQRLEALSSTPIERELMATINR
jgi:hypothetical protein